MRPSTKSMLLGLVTVFAVGCSSASVPHDGAASSTRITNAQSAADQPNLAGPDAKARAAAIARRFGGLYRARQFAASWHLLTPAARHAIAAGVWVRVHDRCRISDARASRTITAVTVFGNAAIVSETVAGPGSRQRTAEDVFDYINGQWGYEPQDMGVYLHGSISADVAAAKAAGLCRSWKDF